MSELNHKVTSAFYGNNKVQIISFGNDHKTARVRKIKGSGLLIYVPLTDDKLDSVITSLQRNKDIPRH